MCYADPLCIILILDHVASILFFLLYLLNVIGSLYESCSCHGIVVLVSHDILVRLPCKDYDL